METRPRATFRKGERLTGSKALDDLVKGGSTLTAAPLRLTWMAEPGSGGYPARIAISVPKKYFPLAVDRNRIRRQLREVYRKNKHRLHAFLMGKGLQASLLLVYAGKERPDYSGLEMKFTRILTLLEERLP
jgi:ribonuclease P protein component